MAVIREKLSLFGVGILAGALWIMATGEGRGQTLPVAQSPTSKLQFEVASVRQNRLDDKPYSNFPLNPGPQFSPSGGHLVATNMLLLQYIVFAYKTTSFQIQSIRSQLPDWARSDHFDIEARVEGEPTKDQMRWMMRSLLEDRFKLTVHHESHLVSIFSLVLAKQGSMGPDLVQHPEDDPTCSKAPLPQSISGGYPAACGAGASMPASVPGLTAIGGRKVTMEMFAVGLTNLYNNVDRPVIDQTGLSGTFDYTLEWMPEPDGPMPPDGKSQPDVGGPTFAEALKKQLGLKLLPEKAPIDVIVLDRVEHPSAN
jgi:uncharacterized protein (TIGR03435 family)